MEEFYWRIAEGQVPRSSQPPIGDVAEAYERYPEAEILNIAIADGLSGTYQGACAARELMDHGRELPSLTAEPCAAPTGIWWRRFSG